MENNDVMGKWLKENLDEDLKDIRFSAEAREKVRARISSCEQTALEIPKPTDRLRPWWNKHVIISVRAASFCLLLLITLAVFYAKTFFYVSTEEIARFETRPKVILHDNSVPFGALQHLVASASNPDMKRGW